MTVQGMKDVAELDFLGGSVEAMDEFNMAYEQALNEARITGDKGKVRKMQLLAFKQFVFLFNEWRKEKAQS